MLLREQEDQNQSMISHLLLPKSFSVWLHSPWHLAALEEPFST